MVSIESSFNDSLEQIKAAERFLLCSGMSFDRSRLAALSDMFLSEMELGLCGKSSTLLMLPAYIAQRSAPPKNRRVLAVDAGGTNLRVACVSFAKNGDPSVETLAVYQMPGKGEEIDLTEFFGKIAGYLSPIAEKSDELGFCFSFPCEILPNGDGRILYFDKELKITGAEGASIRGELNAALTALGHSDKRVTVINDSAACAVCGGLFIGSGYDGHIGFIAGTGTNICYFEKPSEIKKISAPLGDSRLAVNIESGGFGGFPQGEFDRELDSRSADPERHKFEKMVSGGYFGSLILLTLKGLARSGILSVNSAYGVSRLTRLTSGEVYGFYSGVSAAPLGEIFESEDDRTAALTVIGGLYRRAAALSAVALFSALRKDARGKSSDRPIGIVAEGTMFYGCEPFREALKRYLESLCLDSGAYFEFIGRENAVLIGAAAAAVSV